MKATRLSLHIWVVALCTLAVTSLWAQAPEGLVGYWSFDEVSGITVHDGGPHAYLGTLFGQPQAISGRVGQALSFGPYEYMEVPHAAELNLSDQFTMDFWLLSPERAPESARLLTKGDFRTGWDLPVNPARGINLRTTGLQAIDHFVAFPFEPERWYHVAWVYGNRLAQGSLKVFINGELAQQWDEAGSFATNDKPLVAGQGLALDELRIYRRPLSAEEVKARYQTADQFIRQEVFVSSLWPEKLLFKPSETVKITTSISSLSALPRQVQSKIYIVQGLDNQIILQDKSVQFAAGESREFNLEWNPGDYRFGFAVVHEISDLTGRLLDEKTEYFLVADNPYAVGQKSGLSLRAWDEVAVRRACESAVRSRANYLPLVEVMGVGPDNFSKWVPDTDQWFAGQGSTAYRNSTEAVRGLVEACHQQGLAIVVYINSAISGAYGTELARQHPEWMVYNARGHFSGGLETRQLELLQEFYRRYPESLQDQDLLDSLRQPDKGGGLQISAVNVANRAAIIYSIRQIIAGLKYFGFDGLRWDGHYQVAAPSDPAAVGVPRLLDYRGQPVVPDQETADRISAENTRLLKQMVWEEFPEAIFGYNWGHQYEKYGLTRPLDYAECARDGGMILWESINGIYRPSSPWHRWKDCAEAIADEVEHPQQHGGFLNLGWFHWWLAKDVFGKHLLPIIMAARGHLSGAPGRVPVDYYRFAARYSELLYDLEINRAPELRDRITVMPDRIWWEKYVYERKTPEGRQIIIHLLNPPATEHVIIDSEQAPEPVENLAVNVQLLNGYQVTSVYLLSPEVAGYSEKLDYDLRGPNLRITVPELKYWDIVVINCS